MSATPEELAARARAAAEGLPPLGDGVVIAIDGPAGTGKSTAAKLSAARLGLAYLDTGASYRAATWWALHQGIDTADQDAVADAVRTMPYHPVPDPKGATILMGERDITREIRTPELTLAVGPVATNLAVRELLAKRHRAIVVGESRGEEGCFSAGRGVVTEGRDVATVVAPDAKVRIYLTASDEVRMRRRQGDAGNEQSDAETLRAAVTGRDAIDSTVAQFTTAADGIVSIDTSQMSIDDVVAAIVDLARASTE